MPDRDMPLVQPVDIATALALLTRLPLPMTNHTRSAQAAWAYPLAGLAVGVVAALTGLVAHWFGLPPSATAGLMLTAGIVATGALHEDGLADTVDGFWGANDKAQRLKIMRDSRIGTYGTLALIVSVGLRWTALTTLVANEGIYVPVIVAAILSRAAMPAVMHALPHAHASGLSHQVGRPSRATAALAVVIAVLLSLSIASTAIIAACITALATFTVAAVAKAKIGGQTGDVLGATQQLSEIAILLTLAAMA